MLSNWSYPETTNRSRVGFDLCDFDLLPLTLTFAGTLFLSSVLLLKIPRWYNITNIANGKNCAHERVNGLIRSKSFN